MSLFELVFSFSLCKYPQVEFLDHMVVLFLFLGGTSIQWLHQFIFSPTVHKNYLFSTPSPTLVISCLFDNSYSNRCLVISHCGFDLQFHDD